MVTTSNIYIITNKLNNKKYVGQAIDINQRWMRHRSDYKRLTSKYLYRAMNKYGIDNFLFEVLESEIPIESIHEREIFWIEQLGTKAPLGYNMTDGGEGSINRIVSAETREKISNSKKGSKCSDESKKNFSKRNKLRYENIDARVKMSVSHKNNDKLIKKATETIQKVNQEMCPDLRLKNLELAVSQRSKPVIATNLINQSLVEFKSTREAARWIKENTEFKKACHTNISKACRKKIDYVYGYEWKYK